MTRSAVALPAPDLLGTAVDVTVGLAKVAGKAIGNAVDAVARKNGATTGPSTGDAKPPQ